MSINNCSASQSHRIASQHIDHSTTTPLRSLRYARSLTIAGTLVTWLVNRGSATAAAAAIELQN